MQSFVISFYLNESPGLSCTVTMLTSIIFFLIAVVYELDSSKQRTRIRHKVSLEKDSLQRVVMKYNELVGDSGKVCLENIENGVFPWHVTDNSLNNRGKPNCLSPTFSIFNH